MTSFATQGHPKAEGSVTVLVRRGMRRACVVEMHGGKRDPILESVLMVGKQKQMVE